MNTVPLNLIINMNGIVNKVLLAADIFMPEKHLKQPRFTYSSREPSSKKIKKGLKNLKKKEIQDIFPEMN